MHFKTYISREKCFDCVSPLDCWHLQ